MNGESRARLVKTLARAYQFDQLNGVVRKVLHNNLEYYVARADMLTVADQLLSKLEQRRDDLEELLLWILAWTRKVELKAAITEYLDLPDEDGNVYDALIVLEEPFVNRQMLRQNLRELFEIRARGALVVRGTRWVGKSHSRWLIQHIAKKVGVEIVHLDLVENSVDDIIGQLINEMNLPVKEFKDRVAQVSTVGKGLASALRGISRTLEDGHNWCLVFDGHDREEAAAGMRELVEPLLHSAAKLELQPIQIILLGYGKILPVDIRVRILEDDVAPLSQRDVENFLKEFAARSGQVLPETRCASMCSWIFDGLAFPLNQDGMKLMNERLRKKLAEVRNGGS